MSPREAQSRFMQNFLALRDYARSLAIANGASADQVIRMNEAFISVHDSFLNVVESCEVDVGEEDAVGGDLVTAEEDSGVLLTADDGPIDWSAPVQEIALVCPSCGSDKLLWTEQGCSCVTCLRQSLKGVPRMDCP